MKKPLLSVALAIAMAAAAQAQVVIDYTRNSGNSRLRITYSSGYGYGFGYGGYYGWGGFGYGTGYSTYYGGLGAQYYSGYASPWMGGGYGYAGPMGGSGYYGGGYAGYGYPGYGGSGGYRGSWGRPNASADAAGPMAPSRPAADRMAEFASAREIEEGRRRLKLGDYKGAVDDFRSAVAAHTENPIAQAWFAVALALTGDGKNADKALRAAVAGGLPADRIALGDAFRDDKERSRVLAALGKSAGEGSLAAAFALAQQGDAAKLKQMAEKDPVARQLLPK